MVDRVAHFLLHDGLANNPLNDALIGAYFELGLEVDLYVPGGQARVEGHDGVVRPMPVEYGYKWLMRNALSPRWARYKIFSGTTEDPMAIAGTLGRIYHKPVITQADEIKSGSYAGNRSERWKRLCRWGMRASSLTMITDPVRIQLQRDYVGLTADSRFAVHPCSFRVPPPPLNVVQAKRDLGIPDDALVLGYSGTFYLGNGAEWLLAALRKRKDLHVLGQLNVHDSLINALLTSVIGVERLHRLSHGASWRNAWSASSMADVGMVVYLQDGPQFQNMGISSNRLCMFLTMGVPVIASRQPSFRFIEDYDCGVLVDNEAEFIAAIDRIAGRLDEMKANALRCAREYIDAPGKYLVLRDAIARLVGVKAEGERL